MTDEITDGICLTLNSEFGDDYEIYTEKVKQGLKEPCFIVSLVDAESTPLLRTRSKRDYNFDVIYIPKYGTNAELLSMADKLFGALRFITNLDGTKMFGFDMRYEITDDVLHFFVRYPVTMRENEELPPMEGYALSQKAGF